MERLTTPSTELLKRANGDMRRLLDRLVAGESAPVTVTADDLAGLLAGLEQAAHLLRQNLQVHADMDWAKELSQYRELLAQLRAALSELQVRLQVERARLDRDALHVNAAAAWTRVNKGTF